MVQPYRRASILLALTLMTMMWSVSSAQSTVVDEIPDVETIPQSLANYVQAADDVYGWELKTQQTLPQGSFYDIQLTSQKWQGIVWQHNLQVFEPEVIRFPKHALLFVTGGRNGKTPGASDLQRGMALAKLCGARVAVIHQVPNQPLFGDRVEDDLITETWLKYLETGDETWPLLFPMVKSAVRAMDAVQELSAQQWDQEISSFVITGASKRGWTSWLTPVADARVVGTAPVVIDVLNFRAQMKHQLDTWGKYSEQIDDYTRKGLIVTGEETPREKNLRVMMDPYTYRDSLQLPKLMVNGTNDPYWVVDAMQFYWDDLKGPKYVLQVPNAGHGLDDGVEYALSTVAAFFQHVASGKSLPDVQWSVEGEGDSRNLSVKVDRRPLEARLWSARSEDKDFRDEKWESKAIPSDTDTIVAGLPKPASYTANYVELKYEINGVPYSLCTRIYRD